VRHRSRRRAGPRRKTDWRGFHFWSEGFIPFTTQPDTGAGTVSEVAYTWAKWPAGLINTVNTNQLEPVDETLVHIVCKAYATIRSDSANDVWFLSMGIICWDSVFPGDFENVLGSGADNPDPFNLSLDWVWRTTYIVTTDPAGTTGTVAFFPTLDTEFKSRAMRKLPETTGLLCCVSMNNPNMLIGDPTADLNFGITGRYLVKSGSAY